ncbi:Zn(2)-C6 fungal-type transcription factor [Pseudohyphozyma bogoriensis]|nr:Zn(2)-C6 fungal-type transcription factor [Pseudohyphozyma bogoriensis]
MQVPKHRLHKCTALPPRPKKTLIRSGKRLELAIALYGEHEVTGATAKLRPKSKAGSGQASSSPGSLSHESASSQLTRVELKGALITTLLEEFMEAEAQPDPAGHVTPTSSSTTGAIIASYSHHFRTLLEQAPVPEFDPVVLYSIAGRDCLASAATGRSGWLSEDEWDGIAAWQDRPAYPPPLPTAMVRSAFSLADADRMYDGIVESLLLHTTEYARAKHSAFEAVRQMAGIFQSLYFDDVKQWASILVDMPSTEQGGPEGFGFETKIGEMKSILQALYSLQWYQARPAYAEATTYLEQQVASVKAQRDLSFSWDILVPPLGLEVPVGGSGVFSDGVWPSPSSLEEGRKQLMVGAGGMFGLGSELGIDGMGW